MRADEKMRRRFRGRKELKGRTKPRFPESPEREYRRLMLVYTKVLNRELKRALPEILGDDEEREQTEGFRFDRIDRKKLSKDEIRKRFDGVMQRLALILAALGMPKRMIKVGKRAAGIARDEWKRAAKSTLGIDLLESHYNEAFYALRLQKWAEEGARNGEQSIRETLKKIEETVLEGIDNGNTGTEIREQIQEETKHAQKQAELSARTQVANLNSKITQDQQRDAGITKYVWTTAHDERVRPCHEELDGKVISWDSPPEMWYDTKSRGRIYTGRFCHPGEDYLCRCVAIPVFDIDTLNVQTEGASKRNE